MIANVLGLDEITKKYRVKFDSGDEMLLGCILEIILLSLQLTMMGFISVKRIIISFRKVD